ncbi:UNVERIFIED_CONTAM: hypothetical protein GTU68_023264 [Idotea baltica]
MENKV